MTNLSQNWKRLNTKIRTQDETSNQLKPNKKFNKIDKPQHNNGNKIRSKTLSIRKNNNKHEQSLHINPVNKQNLVSPMEYILWTKEGNKNILKSEIPNQPQLLHKSQKDKRKQPGKYIAMDCEFVGVGPEGENSALARVTIINYYGHVLLDEYVQPKEKITDFRTWVSGIQPWHLKNALSFEKAQQLTNDLITGKILIGHALNNDLNKLFLDHPFSMIRDTCNFPTFKKITGGRNPSLKKLSEHFLGIDIQVGEHDPIEDSRATMLLFRLFKREFEESMRNKK
ncbi:REX4 [Candida jiufengensis]|uniref:REX4 n=1 Tax=Candida jiufengensis TaxID=497108 RepID=UPI002224D4E7|nr:REX4 [Candida jiufengensis]KAI5954645.1 REX4 [Candida jiufengensis]